MVGFPRIVPTPVLGATACATTQRWHSRPRPRPHPDPEANDPESSLGVVRFSEYR